MAATTPSSDHGRLESGGSGRRDRLECFGESAPHRRRKTVASIGDGRRLHVEAGLRVVETTQSRGAVLPVGRRGNRLRDLRESHLDQEPPGWLIDVILQDDPKRPNGVVDRGPLDLEGVARAERGIRAAKPVQSPLSPTSVDHDERPIGSDRDAADRAPRGVGVEESAVGLGLFRRRDPLVDRRFDDAKHSGIQVGWESGGAKVCEFEDGPGGLVVEFEIVDRAEESFGVVGSFGHRGVIEFEIPIQRTRELVVRDGRVAQDRDRGVDAFGAGRDPGVATPLGDHVVRRHGGRRPISIDLRSVTGAAGHEHDGQHAVQREETDAGVLQVDPSKQGLVGTLGFNRTEG